MRPAFHHILVATDGSRLSERGIKAAIEMARAHNARMTVFHAIPAFHAPAYADGMVAPMEFYSAAKYKAGSEAHAAKLLGRVARRARLAHVECDTVAVTSDVPWRAIVDAATSRHCDLIVMASHGRRGLEALLLGSETRKVITHSGTPVLVCH